ncbi:alpha/beta fold hydrolase [Streptomyces sp. NPDC058457]|uniref:alpha/beta fold hydrolase n=1 Tax=Streptomyces sp. NPDC058457 TaxID=3346507 RepID=UPI00364ADBE4
MTGNEPVRFREGAERRRKPMPTALAVGTLPAAGVPAGKARLMAAGQRPVAPAAFAEPSGTPAWRTVPSWFLVAGADQEAIPPAAEQAMALRAGSRTEVIRGASHTVLVSHPDATAHGIEAAARATS